MEALQHKKNALQKCWSDFEALIDFDDADSEEQQGVLLAEIKVPISIESTRIMVKAHWLSGIEKANQRIGGKLSPKLRSSSCQIAPV